MREEAVHRERGQCELGRGGEGGREVWVTAYKGPSAGCYVQTLASEEVTAGPRLGQ